MTWKRFSWAGGVLQAVHKEATPMWHYVGGKKSVLSYTGWDIVVRAKNLKEYRNV